MTQPTAKDSTPSGGRGAKELKGTVSAEILMKSRRTMTANIHGHTCSGVGQTGAEAVERAKAEWGRLRASI